jgi:hypothetical protein
MLLAGIQQSFSGCQLKACWHDSVTFYTLNLTLSGFLTLVGKQTLQNMP